MSRIAFFGMSARGHLNPSIGVLQELAAAGHELHVFGYQSNRDYLASYGLTVTAYEDVFGPGLVTSPFERDAEAIARGVSTAYPEARREFFTALTTEVTTNITGYQRLLKELQPDVVIHTLMFPGPRYAAQSLSIPLVTSGSMAISPKSWLGSKDPEVAKRIGADFAVLRQATAPLHQLRDSLGLTGPANPVDVFNVSRDLVLAYTSLEFQGDWDETRPYRFVGPVLRRRVDVDQAAGDQDVDGQYRQQHDQPLVFVSLGTQAEPGPAARFFGTLAEAVADLPVSFVIATGVALAPDSLDLPDNVTAVEYVPQTELLPKVDAVICQGGFGTVHEALSEAKPVWALMMDNDHFQVGGRLAASRAGIATLFGDGTAEVADIRAKVDALLTSEQMRAAAAQVQKGFVAAGGAKAARAAIEEIAKS
jgi:MGT family glycosyltransferase